MLVLVIRLVLAPKLVVGPNDPLVGLGVCGCGVGAGNTLGVGEERRRLEARGLRSFIFSLAGILLGVENLETKGGDLPWRSGD